MQFFWNLNTVTANKLSLDDIEAVHEEACNGECSGINVTWSLLRQGAQDYYGINNPQYLYLVDRGDAFGVDEDQF